MSTVIKVEGLSKLYRLGEVGTGSLAHDVNRWWHKVRGKEDPYLKVGQVNDRTKRPDGRSSQSAVSSRQGETESRQLAVGSGQEGKGSCQTTVDSGQSATDDCKLQTGDSAKGGPAGCKLPTENSSSSDYVYALRDISFDVQQGEVLGIIGRNGAGKSTLLKILSRVTVQTTGRIRVKGRIASLLEVGTGFHPELTGRENIFLNGAILGMRKAEIKAKFDEIVDFSGCERYIDTPVKRYSSGMYVRLAFAVAAHLEPEILIVDEVLAVGDAEFQKKCLGKMKDVAGHGRTVLFVSHNMTAVKSLCSRTILMRNGILAADGKTEEVISGYQNFDFSEALERSWKPPIESESYQKHGVYLKESRVVFDRTTDDLLRVGTPFQLRFCVNARAETEVGLSPHYLGVAGEVIFAAPSPKYHLKPGDNCFTCHIPGQFFNDGLYTLMVMIVKDSGAIQTVDEALIFEVHEVERTGNWFGKWPGVVRPKFEWDFQQSEYNLLA